MNFDIQQHLPENFDNNSRVWIYQSNRLFLIDEALEMETILKNFVGGWQSHGTPVKGYANLFYGRFLVFMADETAAGVSGCSTDSSVRVVKQIEQRFNADMFDRQLLCFMKNDKIEQIPLNQLSYAIANGFITETDLYFDNTVATKEAILNRWPAPAGETWLQRMFTSVKSNN